MKMMKFDRFVISVGEGYNWFTTDDDDDEVWLITGGGEGPDLARGEGNVETSSSSEDDDSEEEKDDHGKCYLMNTF